MNHPALKELLVLRVLQDHPAHGYALSEMLEAGLGWTLGLNRATVYTVLGRLEKRGWLTGSEQREGRYPEKHVYTVTSEGLAGYAELLERTYRKAGQSIQPFAALILHADELAPEARQETLQALLVSRQELHATLVAFPPHGGSTGIALAHMVGQLELELATLRELL